MKKKNKRKLQEQNIQKQEPSVPEKTYPTIQYSEEKIGPDFSYLFDKTAQEGQEYDWDTQRIHDERQSRVDQVTMEIPSLKDDEVYSHYQRTDVLEENSYIAPNADKVIYRAHRKNRYIPQPIQEENNLDSIPVQQHEDDSDKTRDAEPPVEQENLTDDTDLYSMSPLSSRAVNKTENNEEPPTPDSLPVTEKTEVVEQENCVDDGEDEEIPCETSHDDLLEPTIEMVIDVKEDTNPTVAEDETVIPETTQPSVPEFAEGFVMPTLDDDDDEDEVIYSEPEPEQSSDLVQEPEILSESEESPQEDNQAADKKVMEHMPPPNKGNDGEVPDNNTEPTYLKESPEIVTFSSLEEDPRRNESRISSLDGLTRYLNDDDANVAPGFYLDEDYDDVGEEKEVDDPGESDQLYEYQDQLPLPSTLLFSDVLEKPKNREEFNELKAHIFHSDLGFRKYHITIANLFDVINVERKIYVKYHPRSGQEAPSMQSSEPEAQNVSEKSTTNAEKSKPVHTDQSKTAVQKKHYQAEASTDKAAEEKEIERPEDVSKIRAEIKENISDTKIKLISTGILAFLSLFFNVADSLGISLPEYMRVSGGTKTFLIINALLLAGVLLLNFNTVAGSIKNMISRKFDSNIAISITGVFCLLHNLILFAYMDKVNDGSLGLYSGLASLGMVLQLAGKLFMYKRIERNLKFVASSKSKKVIRLISDSELSHKLATNNNEPIIAYQTRTHFLSGFMNLSCAPDQSEKTTQSLTPILLWASVAIGLIAGISHGSIAIAFTATAAALCASMPIACMLAINLPMYQMTKKLLNDGVLMTSSASVDEYCDVNNVILNASELFPKGSVVMHGIKKFGNDSAKQIMSEMAAVVCSVKGPLCDMFADAISNGLDLSNIEVKVDYIDNMGFSGIVNGEPVYVGTSDWMKRQGIPLPLYDTLKKHMNEDHQLLYYAKSGLLVAFFTLSHTPNPAIIKTLRNYQQLGGKLLIRSTDPFITSYTLSEWFDLDSGSIQILSSEQRTCLREVVKENESQSAAFMATTGRASSFLRAINSCIKVKLNFTLVVALQAIAMILGAVITAIFSIFSSVSVLSAAALLVFMLFWLGTVLLIPIILKT